jgi:hypothetical protein
MFIIVTILASANKKTAPVNKKRQVFAKRTKNWVSENRNPVLFIVAKNFEIREYLKGQLPFP